MIRRALVVAAVATGLSMPVAAQADDAAPVCVPVPVGTVGLHAQVGSKTVHVPAVTNVALCVSVAPIIGQQAPVDLEVYLYCGFPCFRVVIEEGQWTVASTHVSAYLSYAADGVSTVVPLADIPIWVANDNPNPVCVAVGNPIPECPENSLAIETHGL